MAAESAKPKHAGQSSRGVGPEQQRDRRPQGVRPKGARPKGPRRKDIAKIIAKGLRHEKKGNKKAAANCYLEAFNRDPSNLDALKLIGKTLSALGNRHVAIQVFERALALNENDTDVISALGNMALDMKYPDLALKMFNLFTAREPDSFIGYNNQATALRQLERFDESVAVCQHALARFPARAELWNTLATVVTERDGIEASLVFYEEAMRLNPKMISAASNLARAYSHVGRFHEAIDIADRAIAVDPEFIEAHFVISTALLAVGELRRGWAEYEWRKHSGRRDATLYTHLKPLWDGGDIAGKRLLICAEQGIGDELLFASCFHDLIDRGAQLVIGCDHRLVSLYRRSFPGADVGHYVDFYADATRHRHLPWLDDVEPVDFAIECGSLGQYLRPDFDSFPDREGYLTPDPERIGHWRKRLDALGDGLKVGVCWRSGIVNHERGKEYTNLDQWGPILTTPGARFINLQYDDCAAELAAVEQQFGVKLHGWDDLDLKNDFEATTALSAALDLVICPTTAPGITAASVGAQWWAMASVPPWWLYGRESSPEIRGCTMMPYPVDGDWDAVIAKIAARLKARVGAR